MRTFTRHTVSCLNELCDYYEIVNNPDARCPYCGCQVKVVRSETFSVPKAAYHKIFIEMIREAHNQGWYDEEVAEELHDDWTGLYAEFKELFGVEFTCLEDGE